MNRSLPRVLATTLFSVALFGSASILAADAGATTLDGKQIFPRPEVQHAVCHSVDSAGITPTSKIKAPDLAGLASKEDPAFLTKFLKKVRGQEERQEAHQAVHGQRRGAGRPGGLAAEAEPPAKK